MSFPTSSSNWHTTPSPLLFGGSRRSSDPACNFLSNFYPCSPPISLWGLTFKNVESAFQARKFTEWNGEHARKISEAKSPVEAKRLGKKVRLSEEQLEEWEAHLSEETMKVCLEGKFVPGSELARKLLDTGDSTLVEDNRYKKWGVGTGGIGRNLLGVMLMERREELRRLEAEEEGQSKEGDAEEISGL
jgi:ribA/ribD-fused uncharacterized protein